MPKHEKEQADNHLNLPELHEWLAAAGYVVGGEAAEVAKQGVHCFVYAAAHPTDGLVRIGIKTGDDFFAEGSDKTAESEFVRRNSALTQWAIASWPGVAASWGGFRRGHGARM